MLDMDLSNDALYAIIRFRIFPALGGFHKGDLPCGLYISATFIWEKHSRVARYGQLAARRRQELLDTFSRLIDYVNENQVDFILCSGDFLNSEELRVEELRNINAIIDRLQRAVLVAISGNHDPQTENSAYQKIQWSRRLYLAPPGVGRVALSSYKTIITYHSWTPRRFWSCRNSCPKSGRRTAAPTRF